MRQHPDGQDRKSSGQAAIPVTSISPRPPVVNGVLQTFFFQVGRTRYPAGRLTGLDGRTVRLMIERERREGRPILADNATGYYLPATEHERAACVRSMRHRAAEILAAARAIERGGD